jgi:NAD(P)-dependent dehydrogenase (short-subunit alcohol dehydrogenase family)
VEQAGELWRYDGRRAVVTGCASGIGASLARQLTELGAEVVGLDVRQPAGGIHTFHQIDLADPESIGHAVSAISGPVHALFNVAGVSAGIGDPRRVVSVNFLGLRHLTTALAPRMPAGSSIANVASVAASGYRENARLVSGLLNTRTMDEGLAWCDAHADDIADGCYQLSKAAVILYTMSEGASFAARGVRLNCICPGVTETPILNDTREAYGQEFLDNIPKPLGRVAMPDEQAAILVFMNSQAATYLSGEVLWADGGHVSSQAARQLLNPGISVV